MVCALVLRTSFPFTEIVSYVNNVGFVTVAALLQNGTGSGTGISVVYPSASSDVQLWFLHSRYHRYAVDRCKTFIVK
jgi:hypothetical protein